MGHEALTSYRAVKFSNCIALTLCLNSDHANFFSEILVLATKSLMHVNTPTFQQFKKQWQQKNLYLSLAANLATRAWSRSTTLSIPSCIMVLSDQMCSGHLKCSIPEIGRWVKCQSEYFDALGARLSGCWAAQFYCCKLENSLALFSLISWIKIVNTFLSSSPPQDVIGAVSSSTLCLMIIIKNAICVWRERCPLPNTNTHTAGDRAGSPQISPCGT